MSSYYRKYTYSMPTQAAPQNSVRVLPPDGTVGAGMVNVPTTSVTPVVVMAAPAQLEDCETENWSSGFPWGILNAERREPVNPALAARSDNGDANVAVANTRALAMEVNNILNILSRQR